MWQDKARRVIAELCRKEYLRANTQRNGTRYKKHRPYTVPEDAEFLIRCLDTNDEAAAKSFFVWKAA